jgi:hypothetical protein
MTQVTKSFVLCALLCATVPARADEPDMARAAEEHFKRGVDLFTHHDPARALSEFEESFRLNPIAEVRQNLALCLNALGRYVEAAQNVELYLKEASARSTPLSAKHRADAMSLLDEINAKLATLSIATRDGATVRVDDKAVGTTPLAPLRLDPGPHRIDVSCEGFEDAALSVMLESGKTSAALVPLSTKHAAQPATSAILAPAPTPVATRPSFLRTTQGRAALGLGGVALAVFATSAVTGGVAWSDRDRYRASCKATCNDSLYVRAHGLAIATDALFAVGGVAAITSVVLLVVRPKKRAQAALTLLRGEF